LDQLTREEVSYLVDMIERDRAREAQRASQQR
jgi:hypothetical protein